MPLDVAALLDAAKHGRVDRVRDLARGVSEAERRAALPEVKKAASALRKGNGLWSVRNRNDAVGLAVLACTTGGAAVAGHITRWWRWGPPEALIVPMLLDREVEWLPEVLRRLADEPARDSFAGHWQLTEALRVAIGAPRPTTPAYLQGLTWQLTHTRRKAADPAPAPLLDRLRADDELVALLPHIVELEDAGNQLGLDKDYVFDEARRTSEIRPKPIEDTWAGAVAALCAEGRLDRGATADACLRMMLRGGAPARTAHHLAILTTLALTPEETAARQRSHVQLLGDGNGPCAKYAQRALRAADDVGLLDRETLLEASRLVLARPDKGLATTQLGWLDRVAGRRQDTCPDDVLLVVADAFAHERTDVQERALAVSAKHLSRVRSETLDELVLAAECLAPSLRGTASDVLGVPFSGDPGDHGRPPVVTPATGRGAWPAGVRDVGELAEACAALVEQLDDPVLLESVLAGVARLRNADRDAFDAAMAPVRHRLRPRDVNSESFSALTAELEATLPQARLLRMVLLEPPVTTRRWRGLFAKTRHVHTYALPDPPLSPAGVAVQRMREVAVQVLQGEVADLVATPTEADGRLDPEVLASRLRRLEADGHQPWPGDLQQALLRLPRLPGEAAVGAADRLRSPAGRMLADHLRRGHPDPVSRLLVGRIVPRTRWMWPARPAGDVALAALDGPPVDPTRLATLAMSLPDPFLRAGRVTRTDVALGMGLWPTALPSHPEVLAAHALLAVCDLPAAPGTPSTRALVAALPQLDGPPGQGVWAALGYTLGAADAADRTAAADALVGLAARGCDGAPAGDVLARLVIDVGLKLGRVAASLADAQRTGPAVSAFIWQLAAAALPTLLEQGVRDTHRLVAVAADAAATVGARGGLAGLAAVSARGGSSRLVTEARRLERVLAG